MVPIKPGWLEPKRYVLVMVYADKVNVVGGSVHTIKKTTDA